MHVGNSTIMERKVFLDAGDSEKPEIPEYIKADIEKKIEPLYKLAERSYFTKRGGRDKTLNLEGFEDYNIKIILSDKDNYEVDNHKMFFNFVLSRFSMDLDEDFNFTRTFNKPVFYSFGSQLSTMNFAGTITSFLMENGSNEGYVGSMDFLNKYNTMKLIEQDYYCKIFLSKDFILIGEMVNPGLFLSSVFDKVMNQSFNFVLHDIIVFNNSLGLYDNTLGFVEDVATEYEKKVAEDNKPLTLNLSSLDGNQRIV